MKTHKFIRTGKLPFRQKGIGVFLRKQFVFSVLILLPFALPANDASGSGALSFADAGRLAVSASAELRNEYRRHYLREGAWTWGLRAYFPQLNFNISEDDRLSQISSDSFTKNYSVGVEQLLWDGGRLSLSRKLEKAELEFELNGLGRAALDIAENAVSFYRQVLFYRKIKDIRKDALLSLEDQRLIILAEIELGLALPLDLAGADLTIAGAKIELLSLSLDLDEAERQLAEILGIEELPPLSEKLDMEKSFKGISLPAARAMAETRNIELQAARLSVTRRQAEAKSASLSWLPVLKLTGNFGLTGQHYPLTKYNWSMGISVEFSSPWIQGRFGGTTGWEPPYDRNARVYSGMSPLPSPAESFPARNALLALEIEKSNYDLAFSHIGRLAEQAVEKCELLEKKRLLAVEAFMLEGEKYRITEVMLDLGKLTRLQLMEARLEYAARETAAVEAALILLEAERELEKMLNLDPGELSSLGGST